MPQKPLISVVIPIYNQNSLLENVLEGLIHQSLARHEYEVIVVDDGSDDPITHLESKYPFTFIRMNRNNGRSTARNKGIESAMGERILFLDSDMIPSNNLLEAHLQASLEDSLDIVVIGYRYDLMHQDGKQAIKFQNMMPDTREELYRINTYDLRTWPSSWQICYSSNLSVSKHMLEQIGGFEEKFQTWGVEDIELGYRLSQYGAKYKLATNAIAYHQWHMRNKDIEKLSNYNNNKLFLEKYRTFDIELFFACSPISSKKCISKNMMQSVIKNVLSCCNDYQVTWPSTPNLSSIPLPCAVLCSGNQKWLQDGWYLFHPSLTPQDNSIGLLGIELPYSSLYFSSVLLTSALLKLPDLLPVIIQEAFRIAPSVWLEVPNHADMNTLMRLQQCKCVLQPPVIEGHLCKLLKTH